MEDELVSSKVGLKVVLVFKLECTMSELGAVARAGRAVCPFLKCERSEVTGVTLPRASKTPAVIGTLAIASLMGL
jgi:hypothetical protein